MIEKNCLCYCDVLFILYREGAGAEAEEMEGAEGGDDDEDDVEAELVPGLEHYV